VCEYRVPSDRQLDAKAARAPQVGSTDAIVLRASAARGVLQNVWDSDANNELTKLVVIE
jgi:hypothetical protein